MAKKKSDDIWGADINFDEQTSSDWDDDDFGLDLGDGKKLKKKRKVKRLSVGRIVWMCFVALLSSSFMGLLGYVLYTNFITYPQQEVVDYTTTGAYCLDVWERQIKAMEVPFDNSYINEEIVYANGDEDKVDFYKKMLSTVEYHPYTVNARNVYGNDYIDKDTKDVVGVDSFVAYGEKVGMEVVDYEKVIGIFSDYQADIDRLMSEHDLERGDVDYENRLVDVFVEFMNLVPIEDIPTKIIDRVPYMVYIDGVYSMSEEEDVYLDRLLFSSYQFYDCLDWFGVYADGSLQGTKEYGEWKKLSDAEKEVTRRPNMFDPKDCCSKLWCGTYYLQNEYVKVDSQGNEYVSSVRAEVGDGTISNPYGLYTDAVTSVFFSKTDSLGNIESYEEYPIRVELIEYGYSQDAIDYFEMKDIRNRGINIASDVQYCYMVFNVTNLSDKELTITENMGLCDVNGNMQARTGVIYGLQGSVTLQPDESSYIETWQSSTSLWKKYVVWGNDFDRRADLVYFRLLAGDVENEDEFKGVTVNTSRNDKE